MKKWALPVGWANVTADKMRSIGNELEIWGHLNTRIVTCLLCGQSSRVIHSHYQRTLTDLPISEYCVQLVLQVRRFRCQNPKCPRKTFAKPLTGIAPGFLNKLQAAK